MRRILSLLAVLALVGVLCSCSDYLEGKSGSAHVLSIGLSYTGTAASELRGTLNDAQEVGASLDSILNGKSIPRNLTYMLQEDAATDDRSDPLYPSRDNVVAKIMSLPVKSNDFVYLYYSGHGQNVWWAECPVCGKESFVFMDSSETAEPGTCGYCNDRILLLDNLLAQLSASGSSASDEAALFRQGLIGATEFKTALLSDPTLLAREVLGMEDCFDLHEAPSLSFSGRSFIVTAPLDAVDFEVWFASVASDSGLSGDLKDRMNSDIYMPKAGSYKGNLQGYSNAVRARINSYGLSWAETLVFTYYWNLYEKDSWSNTSWTMLYMDELVDVLAALPCRVLFIADCCYSGYVVEGRDDGFVSFAESFGRMFSHRSSGNVTVVSASTKSQTSLDSLAYTEEGGSEYHGLFTISLLEVLGWEHSETKGTYEKAMGSVRKIAGYQKTVPDRMTMRQAMEKIESSWSYLKQTPQMNITYLDTVLVP